LRSISVPVLILDGAEEEMVTPDQPVRMAELIPGAELVIMPDTGHFAPFEQPEEFARIVLEFLQA
jgi:pimeloyl-ACP methyl ester carboxylesterase